MNQILFPKKVSDALVSRKVDDEWLIVDQARGKVHQLNVTAAFIWNQCDGSTSVEEIIARSLEYFDIDKDLLSEDVNRTLEDLAELNLLELCEN